MFDFRTFAAMLATHFAGMSASELFRVNIDGDVLWQLYLSSFPEGTNPIYRKRQYHDGSYDRAFIRKMGNVVRINADGTLTTIWDVVGVGHPYDTVSKAMADAVRAGSIAGLFRTKESKIGVVSNIEQRDDGSTHLWHHFHADIDRKHQTQDVDTACGNANTTVQVIRRGLEELTPDAVSTVLELIEADTLYRGTEFAGQLRNFQSIQNWYCQQSGEQAKSIIAWVSYRTPGARIRNTAIGTLLQDLSEGKDVEDAVKAYERMVAPTNYKRPTALITGRMVEDATKTIQALDLESALERRFATIHDVSINDVLWADSSVQSQMKGGLASLLKDDIKPTVTDLKNVEPVPIDTFMRDVLPTAIGMEVLFSNPHQSNLMSITAPCHADAGSLFKWNNNFAWSYNGNITDSIKERVKAAGGNTAAKLRVSLAWFNHDDLDLHAECPEGHVYYANKMGSHTAYRYGNGQILDVDMNAGGGTTRTPVENLSWRNPQDGKYTISVHQFCKRETDKTGFTIEMEVAGDIKQYSYPHAVSGTIGVLSFEVRKGIVSELTVLNNKIIGQGIPQLKWGIQTESFVKVNTVMLSPNYWDGNATGNKHWFFILANCQNDEPTRGIYNEFLKPELEQHRKVFEVLGNRTKCQPSTEQLSGLGFSSTKRDSVIVKVTSRTSTRVYSIQF